MSTSSSPSWVRPAGLFIVVSAVIYALAVWQPFAPSGAATADNGLVGDPVAGEVLFAEGCAGCHGAAGEGGAGPVLQERMLEEAAVAGVVVNGRGTMPAGVFVDQDAQDVAAFVAQLSGGAPTAAPADDAAPDDGDEPAAAGPEPAGEATLFGDNLWGLSIRLDAPAPVDWTVWVDGSAALRPVGLIAAGGTALEEPNVGPPPVIDVYDRVLIGVDAGAPRLVGSISADEAERMRRISNADPDTPGGVALVDGAEADVAVFAEHTRFLTESVAEGNAANLRLHAEHLVNIAEGEPIEELDGDGVATNPGDGFGLVSGYLAALTEDGGDDVAGAVGPLRDALEQTVADARVCAEAQSIAEGADCAEAISGRADAIVTGWTATRTAAEGSLAVDLVEAG